MDEKILALAHFPDFGLRLRHGGLACLAAAKDRPGKWLVLLRAAGDLLFLIAQKVGLSVNDVAIGQWPLVGYPPPQHEDLHPRGHGADQSVIQPRQQ